MSRKGRCCQEMMRLLRGLRLGHPLLTNRVSADTRLRQVREILAETEDILETIDGDGQGNGNTNDSAGPLAPRLEDNLAWIKQTLSRCTDLVTREFTIGKTRALAAYIDGLADKTAINENILKPLMAIDTRPTKFREPASAPNENPHREDVFSLVKERALQVGEVKETIRKGEVIDLILSGDTALLIDGYSKALVASTRGWKTRDISEPITEGAVRGPREGFTEDLRTNTSLIRRRIKSPKLKTESLRIGAVTKTEVVVAYIEGVAASGVVKEVQDRLLRIDTDAILESGYLEEFIEDSPFSPFPTIEHTERSDKVAAALVEGRVAILVDGTPFVLMVPTVFFQFLQSSEDYYERFLLGTAARWIRFLAFLFALLLPSLYIAMTTIHQEMIPTELALSIAGARDGVPFPAFVEAFIMEVAFELLREAGVRLPRPVGQAVSIAGALIIGESAVRAGIVSSAMVIIVALTGIASFSIPAFNLALTLRLLRFPMMIVAAIMGIPGMAITVLVIVAHMADLRSFGVPYLSPVAPASYRDWKDVVARAPWWSMFMRPTAIGRRETVRQDYRLKPVPAHRDTPPKGGG